MQKHLNIHGVQVLHPTREQLPRPPDVSLNPSGKGLLTIDLMNCTAALPLPPVDSLTIMDFVILGARAGQEEQKQELAGGPQQRVPVGVLTTLQC